MGQECNNLWGGMEEKNYSCEGDNLASVGKRQKIGLLKLKGCGLDKDSSGSILGKIKRVATRNTLGFW